MKERGSVSSSKNKEISFFITFCIIVAGFMGGLSSVRALGIESSGDFSGIDTVGNAEWNESSLPLGSISEFTVFTTPDIDSIVVSQDKSFNYTITGTETILSPVTSGSDQDVPAIWRDRIVWRSNYPDPANPQSYYSHVFLYTISTGDCVVIASDQSALAIPDIWEDLVVWSTGVDGNFEVHLHNISRNETYRITTDAVNQIKPRIWGDHIVWQEGDDTDPETGVYLYTISTGLITQLDAGSGYALSPSIWEDRVVWQDGRNWNDYDIYCYDITSGTETQITVDPESQMNPSMWGDSVVYEDIRGSYCQIFLYDMVSGNETQITFGDANHLNPRIYEDYVVYENQSGIYLTDLSTMNSYTITYPESGAIQSNPDIWENRVLWTDNRNGDSDIFLFTIGVAMPPLLVNFTLNTTQGECPFTVAFTDLTEGQVDGWHWNFGDGNHSAEQNPFHTYLVPGSYSATLIVHNPWQRSGILRENLISAGSIPVPRFSVNQTSGPAPLIVQFADESSGLPYEWKWEFGDGAYSTEQNPIHRYDHAGIYDVRSVVTNDYGNATLTKQEFIAVMDGTYQTCILPSRGIEVTNTVYGPLLELNYSLAGDCSFNPSDNPELLYCIPENESGIAHILFSSREGTKFSFSDSETVTGYLGQVELSSNDVVPENVNQTLRDNWRFNYSIVVSDYPKEGRIDLVGWEGSTPDDLKSFEIISSDYNFTHVYALAYTVRFEEENIPDNESATLLFGVSSDWVEQYGWRWSNSLESDPPGASVYVDNRYTGVTPISIEEGFSAGNHTVVLKKSGYRDQTFPITLDDKRNHIHVIRIGDDGSGEVLNTTFIGHDPERNLDFFRAESPNGLSTFGLASLSRSGNLFQMIYLAISSVIGGGGGGSRTSSGLAGAGSTPTPITTQAPTLVPTPLTTATLSGNGADGSGPPAGTPDTPVPTEQPPDEGNPVTTFPGIFPSAPATMVLLKNLSVVFVVILVTVVFYLRWKRRGD